MIDLFIEDYSDYVNLVSKDFNDIFINKYNLLYPILSDYVYIKYYLKDPIFYMLFLTERDDSRNDNGLFYLPKYVDKNSKEFKDADLYFSKCDIRVISKRLGWCLNEIFSSDNKCNEKNIERSISECLWNINPSNEQILRIYIDLMFNHRRMILDYVIKNFPELYEFLLQRCKAEDLLYNNNLFNNLNSRLMMGDVDLIQKAYKRFESLCDKFKESILQMRKEYIQLLDGTIMKQHLMNERLSNVNEIRLYGTPSKSSVKYEYYSDPLSSNCYDYTENLNNLWCFYHNWNPYCGKISDLISIKIYRLFKLSRYSIKFIELIRQDNNNSLFILSDRNYAVKLNQNDSYNLHQMNVYKFANKNHSYEYLRNLLKLDDSKNIRTHIFNLLLKVLEYTVCNNYHFDGIKFYVINNNSSFTTDNQVEDLKDSVGPNLLDLFIPYKFLDGSKSDIMNSKCFMDFNLYNKLEDDLYTFRVKLSFNLKGEIINYSVDKSPFNKLKNEYFNTEIMNCIRGIIDKVLEFRLNMNQIYQDYIDSEIKIKYVGNFEQFLTEFKFHMLDTFKDLNDVQLVNTISKETIDEALDIQELIHEINALQMRWEFDDF